MLIEGLKEHPGAIGAIAGVLGAIGPDAKEALPLLKSALPGLAPTSPLQTCLKRIQVRQAHGECNTENRPGSAEGAFHVRRHAFLYEECSDDPAFKSDNVHRDALREAMKLVWPVTGAAAMEMTPGQMHLFLDSLKTNDPAAYDSRCAPRLRASIHSSSMLHRVSDDVEKHRVGHSHRKCVEVVDKVSRLRAPSRRRNGCCGRPAP